MDAWLRTVGQVPAAIRTRLIDLIGRAGIVLCEPADLPGVSGIVAFSRCDDAVLDQLHELASAGRVLAIAVGAVELDPAAMWRVLDAGAADLLLWPALPSRADDVLCRLQRWHKVSELLDSGVVGGRVAGRSLAWRAMLSDVVEVGHLTQAPVLITGETGTGKEEIAHLIHDLDARDDRGEFVIVDCTTVASELAGSEFFGHERGAFTGAAVPRDGAFALAHRGTLFLDEVGELSAPLQAQLLRVVQEHQYKRLGSNTWQRSEFRLICATHRDLEAAVADGGFRSDLYYRIAAWRVSVPPLRERMDDILPIARFVLTQLDPEAANVEMDPAVRQYLLTREYPGNVRDLRQTVVRLWQRHSGSGPLTVGDVPQAERPASAGNRVHWPDPAFEAAIRHAVELGIGLKEIGQRATELATRAALEQEDGNLKHAAARLGVTDRALQIRRANRRAGQPRG